MQLFYDPDLQSGIHDLSPTEARHVVQVLRKQVGDTIDLVDGRGGWFKGQIIDTGKRSCQLEVELLRRENRRNDYQITLAFGPPKTADRLEWLLEKATEIGVDLLQPVISEHSERRKLRPERLTKILESAMKQSLQAWLPELLPLRNFSSLVAEKPADSIGLMAYINEAINSPLSSHYQAGQNAILLIGPEGGYSPDEAQLALENGFKLGSLGPTRLRTETAAVSLLRDVATINFGR